MGIEFTVKIQAVPRQGQTYHRPVVQTPAASVTLCTYFSEDDAMHAAFEYLKQEWRRRDYGKLFPSEPDPSEAITQDAPTDYEPDVTPI